jgi:hypothetical protein
LLLGLTGERTDVPQLAVLDVAHRRGLLGDLPFPVLPSLRLIQVGQRRVAVGLDVSRPDNNNGCRACA